MTFPFSLQSQLLMVGGGGVGGWSSPVIIPAHSCKVFAQWNHFCLSCFCRHEKMQNNGGRKVNIYSPCIHHMILRREKHPCKWRPDADCLRRVGTLWGNTSIPNARFDLIPKISIGFRSGLVEDNFKTIFPCILLDVCFWRLSWYKANDLCHKPSFQTLGRTLHSKKSFWRLCAC